MLAVKLLSNGNYHVMLTSAGGGYSCWKGLAVTRWHEDAVLDNWGSFCYLRDCATGSVWSNTLQPTLQRPEACQASFNAGSAIFLRQDHEIETRTEIAVSPDDNLELRRVRISNLSQRSRSLNATSFAEIVLAAAATDSAHPAFSKLFVETRIDPALHAILATRRPAVHDEPTPWFFHLALAPDLNAENVSYETDRMRFIGRGHCTVDPQALRSDAPLSGSAGPVLDAVAAIRVPLTLEAGASLTIDWITGIASSRDDCVALARKYQDARQSQRILEQATKYRQAACSDFRRQKAMPCFMSAWLRPSFMPTPRCEPMVASSSKIAVDSRGSGVLASPVICLSCCFSSPPPLAPPPTRSICCINWSRRTRTGVRSASRPSWWSSARPLASTTWRFSKA